MGRLLFVYLPSLPLDLLVRRAHPGLNGPFALASSSKPALLTHLNRMALRQGLRKGQKLADAQALCSDLLIAHATKHETKTLLRALHKWIHKFSPRVAIFSPNGLCLDVSGSAHLFGGEQEQLSVVKQSLSEKQIASRIAIADNAVVAQAVARFGENEDQIIAPGMASDAFANLPVKALLLDAPVTDDLIRLGFSSIGSLYDIKTAELARRFGLELVQRLEQGRGYSFDGFRPSVPRRGCRLVCTLSDPVESLSHLERKIYDLIISLCNRLQKEDLGLLSVLLTLEGEGESTCVTAGFAKPTHAADKIKHQLFSLLDGASLSGRLVALVLEGREIVPLSPEQTPLYASGRGDEAFSDLLTGLGNRLGFDRIQRFAYSPSHIPERSFHRVCALEAQKGGLEPMPPSGFDLPLRLCFPPERVEVLLPGRPPTCFAWRGKTFSVSQKRGPQRISGQWWSERRGALRDYWHVQTAEGLRLWLLTQPVVSPNLWFVAGQFA